MGLLPLVAREQSNTQQDDWVNVLKTDPRLSISLSFKFSQRPPTEYVLGLVKKATGVSLSLARESEMIGATFGPMTFYNVPAWTVLQQIAATQVRDGRWEKSANGYILHGQPSPNGLYVDGADGEKARIAAKEAFHKQLAQTEKAADDFLRMHPLSADPKLRVKLTVIEKDATLPHLMDRLEETTGLSFTLSENLVYHEPGFGHIDVKNGLAFSIMGIIATTDLDNGRWVRTDTGYRLEGASRALRPPPSPFPWILVTLCVVMLAAGLVTYRKRGRKAAATPSKRPIRPVATTGKQEKRLTKQTKPR
jgi:hypothetical protein